MTVPTRRMRCHSPAPRIVSDGGRGGLVHDVGVDGFAAQGESGQAVGDQVDPEDLRGQQRQRQTDERACEHHGDLRGAARQGVEQEAADVGVDAAAFFGGGDDGAEFVVGQDQIGGLAGDFGAAFAHGDADVGAVQGRAVVDAVAGHRDDLPGGLQGVDDGDLLLRGGPGEDPRALSGACAGLGGTAVDHLVAGADDAEFDGDRAGGGRVVAGDQYRGDARALTRGDGRGGGRPRRVEDRDEAEQAQTPLGGTEVGGRVRGRPGPPRAPGNRRRRGHPRGPPRGRSAP